MSFIHSGRIQREEETKSIPPTSELRASLGDWKIMAPLSVAMGVAALSNEMYVVNEETQLAACFFLFCTCVYKYGGDAIGGFFDAKAQAILTEHNAAEDANIALAKQTLATHEDQLELVEDIHAVQAAHKEAVQLMCKVEAAKLRHEIRDIFVKNLNSIIGYESQYSARMQKTMVEYATSKVREVVSVGDETLKAAAFTNALNILDGNVASGGSDGKDPMVSLFCTHLRAYAEGLEAQVGNVVQLTDAEQQELQLELNGFMKRHELEAAAFVAPKEITLSLIK